MPARLRLTGRTIKFNGSRFDARRDIGYHTARE
jgi:hypothetical protein